MRDLFLRQEVNQEKLSSAILQAIEHLESKANSYLYVKGIVPKTRFASVCAIGWIGFYAGIEPGTNHIDTCIKLFGREYPWFVQFMDKNSPEGWRFDRNLCIEGLRALAKHLNTPQNEARQEFKPLKDFI